MNKEESIKLVSKRISKLYSEIDRFKNIISLNRKHIAHAKRRIRILEKGLQFMEQNRFGKAEQLFEKENKIHFSG